MTADAESEGTRARILLVEDDASIGDVVRSTLQGEGYACRCAYSGTEAKLLIESGEPFDLAICDLMLPGMPGEDVVALIRSRGAAPILVTSAKAQVVDRVALLRMGADDYLVKPFDLDELVARVEALLRRAGRTQQAASTVLQVADLTLDVDSHDVRRGGEEITLTNTEFELLRYLMENVGIVLSKQKILDAVWSYDFGGQVNVVELYISYLRKKIDADRPALIRTVRGAGYIMREPQ